MTIKIIEMLAFAVLMNWCVAMQLLNQFSQNKKTKITSTILAILAAIACAAIVLI